MERIVEIADGVWGADTTIGIGLGAHLPLRMTVLRDDDGLLLVSPIAIDDVLAGAIAELGEVRTIVGPNLMHHKHLAAAKDRYPDARLLGAPGLADKRGDLEFDDVADSGPWSHALEARRIEGADKLSEVVLWHRPSRTLVVTDAVFNIPDASGATWLILKYLSGALGRVEQSRLIRTLTKDREATARSVEDVLAWPFDRVVMAHGNVVQTDAEATAVQKLRTGLWWWRGARRDG